MDAELTQRNREIVRLAVFSVGREIRGWSAGQNSGIYDDGCEWWIQVARGDDDINTIVLRLSRFASVFNAVAALKRWNWSGTSVPRIVRAMSLV